MATLLTDPQDMQKTAEDLRRAGHRVGVVPTMGYLHEGHLELIRVARQHADRVITTVFVNPAQFGPREDYTKYPRDLDGDIARATVAGTDYIFAPETPAMYHPDHVTWIVPEKITSVLEGKSRPGHFQGVATVVAKLFNITLPHVAVFGQKDAQQVVVVRRLIRDLNFNIALIVVPVVREADGLAMSSRNVYLTEEQRREAPVLYRSLRHAEEQLRKGEQDAGRIIREMSAMITEASSGQIDYLSIADHESLEEISVRKEPRPVLVSLAVRFGSTRLIDNIVVGDEHGV